MESLTEVCELWRWAGRSGEHGLTAVSVVQTWFGVYLPSSLLPGREGLVEVLDHGGGEEVPVDWSVVSEHLRHEGQHSAVVQVELRDDDTVNVLCQRFPHCWLLGATVRDSWLVMAATLWGCWRWHLGAIVRDTWLLVMAATL